MKQILISKFATAVKFSLLFFLFINAGFCYGQSKESIRQEWTMLNKLYQQQSLEDTVYLTKGLQLMQQHEKSSYMPENLSLFKEVLFSKKKYSPFKLEYFRRLANNAMYNENDGRCIFYIEKMENEYKKRPGYLPTLTPYRIQLGWLTQWHQPKEGVEKSKQVQPFIDSLPQLISGQKVEFLVIQNAIIILQYTQEFYQQLHDTINEQKTIEKAQKIYAAVLKKGTEYTSLHTSYLYNDILFLKYLHSNFLNDDQQTEKDLKTRLAYCLQGNSLGYEWAENEVPNNYIYLTMHFIHTKQIDSALKYISLYEQRNLENNVVLVTTEQWWINKSKIEELRGDYKLASSYLKNAIEVKDSITNARLSDVRNNMYAQAESEYNRDELLKTETEKHQRNILIILLIALLGVGATLVFSIMKKREKAAKINIEQLQLESHLHIAELEQKNLLAKQEEQRRLGMELHDSIAGNLAAIKIKLEMEARETKDITAGKRLKEISELAARTYESTRKKSHDWYHTAENTDDSFAERVMAILDKGLPAGKYEKEVLIDNDSLHNTMFREKIQLLYIIQEAVTNILKYAKANKVSVLIYEDVPGLMIQIIDNGIGFDVNRLKKGIGVASMQERVKNIGGGFNIQSGKTGTEITVTIPLTVKTAVPSA